MKKILMCFMSLVLAANIASASNDQVASASTVTPADRVNPFVEFAMESDWVNDDQEYMFTESRVGVEFNITESVSMETAVGYGLFNSDFLEEDSQYSLYAALDIHPNEHFNFVIDSTYRTLEEQDLDFIEASCKVRYTF